MVDIRIIIEGGVLPHSNTAASTIDNSEKLREAFHKLFSKIISPESFNLIIEIGAGYKNAVKHFKDSALKNETISLLIDLDGPKSTRNNKLAELDIADFSNRVFFMVQEMEAWILSQPEAIERCYEKRYMRKKGNESIRILENNLFSHPAEAVSKPSVKLKEIIGRYYLEMKGNVKKNKKYGKLKDAPLLIENLDVKKLLDSFDDLKALASHISK